MVLFVHNKDIYSFKTLFYTHIHQHFVLYPWDDGQNTIFMIICLRAIMKQSNVNR